MDPACEAAPGRKRQGVKLEKGVAETPVAKRGAQSNHEKNHSDEAESQNQENARVAVTGELRNDADCHRNHNHVAEDTDYPRGDFRFLAQTFRLAAGPIRSPQPWRGGICFFDGRLLLHTAITAYRHEQESRADC